MWANVDAEKPRSRQGGQVPPPARCTSLACAARLWSQTGVEVVRPQQVTAPLSRGLLVWGLCPPLHTEASGTMCEEPGNSRSSVAAPLHLSAGQGPGWSLGLQRSK